MVVLGARDRARRAAPARQPAADHAVHGDDRPVVLHRGPGADDVGRERARPRSRHAGRADRSGSPTRRASTSRSSTSSAAGVAAVLVDRARALLQPHAHRPRAARGRRRSPGGARRRHPAAADLGDRLGVAGAVALVAGLLWGARNGVQFALTFVALKALPVLILGGFESIPGAIVGGLIIGASEKLAEVYLGPYVGGGIEGWFPYVLALAVPAGPARRPVRREDHPPHLTETRPMLYREAGQFKTHLRRRTRRSFRSGRIGSRSRVDPRRRVRRRAAASRTPYLFIGDPDPVPDPVAGGARAQHPDRLRGPAVARHGGVHGGGRVRVLQLHAARSRHADAARVRGRRRRGRGWSASCSACRACASAASTSRWRRSPRSSSSCGS